MSNKLFEHRSVAEIKQKIEDLDTPKDSGDIWDLIEFTPLAEPDGFEPIDFEFLQDEQTVADGAYLQYRDFMEALSHYYATVLQDTDPETDSYVEALNEFFENCHDHSHEGFQFFCETYLNTEYAVEEAYQSFTERQSAIQERDEHHQRLVDEQLSSGAAQIIGNVKDD